MIKKAMLNQYLREECGATAIEYGLVAAGIGVAIILTVFAIGETVTDTFVSINTYITS